MPKRPTLALVAQRAGVSVATVSYVLNNKPTGRIPEATRALVRRAAEDLGYTPNAAAQALRTGKSRVVLFIVPHLQINFTIGEMMTEVGAQLDARGHIAAMLVGERTMDFAATVHATAPAAAISLVDLTDADRRLLRQRGVVLLQTGLAGLERQSEWYTHLQQTLVHRQVQHLIDRGHTRIGWAYAKDPLLTALADRRLAWATECAKANGLPALSVRRFALKSREADAAVKAWRAKGVTAVACYNDLWAMTVMEAARRAGVAVPEELAVIGIDNIPLTEIVEPPLTSVSVHMKRNVQALLDELFARMNGEPDPVVDIEPLIRFVQRGST